MDWNSGIVLAVAGYVFKILSPGIAADQMLMIGLNTLATTYFLLDSPFRPQVVDDGNQKAFSTWCPPFCGSCCTLGWPYFWLAFLFAILHLRGARQMLMIGLGIGGWRFIVYGVDSLAIEIAWLCWKDPLIRAVVFFWFFWCHTLLIHVRTFLLAIGSWGFALLFTFIEGRARAWTIGGWWKVFLWNAEHSCDFGYPYPLIA